MNLKEEIAKIVKLQDIDFQIHKLKKEKDFDLPFQIKKTKDEFEEKKQSCFIYEEKAKQTQLKKKDKEIDLATKEENLRKLQGQLYQLKTNKEYQAKLTEIASKKADVSIVEEDLIEILDQLESIQKDLKTQKQILFQEEVKSKEEENKINEQIKNIEITLTNLKNKRLILSKDVDQNILLQYDDFLTKRNGLAIVPVEGGNCGACHMLVTHQTINEIKMYAKLVFCENCVRILYIAEDICI